MTDDEVRHIDTSNLIRNVANGTATIDWPYPQEAYRMAVETADDLGRSPVFADLVRATRALNNKLEADGSPASDEFKAGLRAAAGERRIDE